MVRPVSCRGFQKGFQRGFTSFLELCVCIKILNLVDPACGTAGFLIGDVGINVGEMSENVGETKEAIIRKIKMNPRISASALAKEISVTQRTIERNIQELRESGVLIRHGAARGG